MISSTPPAAARSSASRSGSSAAARAANAAASSAEPVNSSARHERVRDERPRGVVVERLVRLGEVPTAARPSVSTSARPSSSSSPGRHAAGARLLERAPQVRDAALRRAAPDGRAARLAQLLGHPLLPAPRRGEQVRRDLLGRRARVEQHARGPLVLELALAERQLLVDGVAHERVDEAERRLAAQDLRPRQRAGGVGDARLVEPGQRRDGRQRGALGEHGDRAGDRDRVRATAARAA